jgi:predicted dehydrogenase
MPTPNPLFTSRRRFLRDTGRIAAGTAMAAALPSPLIVNGKAALPSEKINIALIGCKNMGFGDLQNALKQPGVECAALCDIDDSILNGRGADVEKLQGKAPRLYKDYRKLLDNKDIDAVIIGTPDHWHCLPFVHACEAGKDIYVEKPLANSFAECDLMVGAARKYRRVVQVGQQQRSGAHFIEAMQFIKSGRIGQLRKVDTWANFNYAVGQPVVPDEPVPAGVDFDRWLGPAPERTFNKSRFHGSWRMFWDYGGGLMTDWGVHLIDIALWARDVATLPLAVTATGGNFAFPDHAHETFDTMSVSYQLKDMVVNWQHTAGTQNGPYGRSYGLSFIGNEGTLVIDRDGWELFPEWDGESKKPKLPVEPKHPGKGSHDLHMNNFLECMRTRKDPACTIENGSLVAKYAHAANMALRTQSQLVWDAKLQNFGDNAKANALITPQYRLPWQLPKI